jgi:tRNA(fMet)-specific endonuclease VapC
LLTEDLIILPLTIDIAQQAAIIFQKLRSENQIIEFRDIFIGASSISNNLPILTLNKKHFSRIKNLEVL